MFDTPSLEVRFAQPYVAIATAVTMDGFGVVEGLTDEVVAWIEAQGAVRAGASFVRIVTSDMSSQLDIEVGVPVDAPPPGDDRFLIGEIPTGSYVTLIYGVTEEHDHYQANVELQAWATSQGMKWAIDSEGDVEVWRGRFQLFRADLSTEGRPVFELIYKVAENSSSYVSS